MKRTVKLLSALTITTFLTLTLAPSAGASTSLKTMSTVTVSSSVAQRNAVRSAKSYLQYMAFSRSGLIKQLEYEGFTHAAARYGVDAQHANWNKQAVKSAKSYLQSMPFSRSGLIKQLEYEGFTHAQAVYGVRKNGL